MGGFGKGKFMVWDLLPLDGMGNGIIFLEDEQRIISFGEL